ncbi:bifunctional diguanylate cyclase/phosphodiesterase [Cognatishimia sp. SS12]|uniref:putative bifunctional diguanylate cyclase/phosphodiesterase n=1 Tax=Cognatishimia sp. SS12 TaxID=2979465 RepID=UPI00232BD605|nr:bifunctional diguanylate cyclase/phosphodiesterase [Cognatishimia sp. SS12]MDC0738335.1 bifunctional diguanylate cyclase/phosphodiesterase [Cognatishimia sp. SS12]
MTRAPAFRPDLIGIAIALLCVAAYQLGGERALLVTAVGLPLLDSLFFHVLIKPNGGLRPASGIQSRAYMETVAQHWMDGLEAQHRKTACFALRIGNLPLTGPQHGSDLFRETQRAIAQRIQDQLRDGDILTQPCDDAFVLVLSPVRHLDQTACLQLAARLRQALEAPIPFDNDTVQLTIAIGFCESDRLRNREFSALYDAAEIALRRACQPGQDPVQPYSDPMRVREDNERKLREEAAQALQHGQITAWFQPQIASSTGKITGFEALARWDHPARGTLPPAVFLDTLTETGQLDRLADLMLRAALEAQKAWEAKGFDIPHVGVNFAGDELRNPMLVDKINWELDRYELAPNRVAIEVLETVIASSADGTVSRNVNGLAKLGCHIDLDDFGTGHASISSIRRFSVSRLKIDRSFVKNIDQDPEQRRLVEAIITMADRLGMETLAEGVETDAELAELASLGCTHIQGYGIARPMPFEATIPWIARHNAALQGASPAQRQLRG